jgi:lipoyl(octanoyl) transferase
MAANGKSRLARQLAALCGKISAMPTLWTVNLGTVPYADAWALQRGLAAARAAGVVPDTLLLLEHPHVFTLGRSGHAENVVWDADERTRRGVDLLWVDRGGDVTYHGPGQLVGYPIMQIGVPGPDGRLAQTDFVGYVRRIEEALIRAVATFGVQAARRPGNAGVWVYSGDGAPPEKVAAIGVRIDARGVSSHGFALNVAPDMDYFAGIVPCGITDGGVTSLARLTGRAVTVAEALPAVTGACAAVFGADALAVGAEQVQRYAQRDDVGR